VPLISAVSLGEAEMIALSNDWGEVKRQRLQELFHELVVVSVESGPVIRAYAELGAKLRKSGKPIGENDMWIAASAVATRAALVSTDRDFLNVPSGVLRLYSVDAKTGDVRQPGGLA
jgi:tRNA(fMet)-specific endonuclease VapC